MCFATEASSIKRSDVYREALRQRPGDARAHEQFGWFLHEQGQTTESIAEYREAARLQPDQSGARKGLAMALRRREAGGGDHRISRGVPARAGGFQFLNYTAWDLVRPPGRPRQEYEMGLMYARKAVELTPKDGYIVNSLALAEYRVGHWAESIAASERSLALVQGLEGVNWFFLPWPTGRRAARAKPGNGSTRRSPGPRRRTRTTPSAPVLDGGGGWSATTGPPARFAQGSRCRETAMIRASRPVERFRPSHGRPCRGALFTT